MNLLYDERFSPTEIYNRVLSVGQRISGDFPESPIVLIAILKGAAVFAADLARTMPRSVRLEYIDVIRGGEDEIVDFESQLNDHGNIVHKFWIHISPEEQLRRFKERQTVDYKQYKITEEDWRNREKTPLYAAAIDDMVARCSTPFAPWTLVAGNDKLFARVQILKTIVQRLEEAL